MTAPVRLQLSRKAGFNLQALSREVNGLPARKVDRSTGYGNPWSINRHESGRWYVDGPGTAPRGIVCANEEGARVVAVDPFRKEALRLGVSNALRGHNLACWCAPAAPCHADVLLEIANR